MDNLERAALVLVGLATMAFALFAGFSLANSSAAVDLLEGRSPLFTQLEEYERRDACVSLHEAQLIAYVYDALAALEARDRKALAVALENGRHARGRLLALNTEDDPCLAPPLPPEENP